MTGRSSLATLALVATLLVVGTAEAISPITARCIRRERLALRECQGACRSSFRQGQVACFGPGAGCAQGCLASSDACRFPIENRDTGTLPLCNQGCADILGAALDECRRQRDLDPNFDEDACGNRGRLANLQCLLACRASVDDAQQQCALNLSGCLAACASCPSPDSCPQ